jgi:tRNA pseudouridine55 synthase
MNKVLLIDKPVGWTSFDVVAKIRGALRKQSIINNQQEISDDQTTNYQLPATKIRVGHAGTLDPFATGLLIVLTGSETKNQDSYMKQDKEYEATLKLGFTSSTGDPEGEITVYSSRERSDSKSSSQQARTITRGDVEKVLESFLGEKSQIPPIYSAIKVDGQRAYKLARVGKTPEMKPRLVRILECRMQNLEYPELKILVKCSSGTYIRTLAEDIGKALGTGAYLTALRRTKIGDFEVKDALSVEEATTSFPSSKINLPACLSADRREARLSRSVSNTELYNRV